MKIKSVEAFAADFRKGKQRRPNPYRHEGREPASPMARYPAYQGKRSSWSPGWESTACLVTAEDGAFGFVSSHVLNCR